jgi:hypothetical protein
MFGMGNRLSKIVTRTGDAGTTGLGDGTRVAKDSLRIETMGQVDELNSTIGLLLTEEMPDDIRQAMIGVQHDLFDLGGELCIPGMDVISEAHIVDSKTWSSSSTPISARSRISSCPVAPVPLPSRILRVPSAAAPSVASCTWQAPKRFPILHASTSIASRT